MDDRSGGVRAPSPQLFLHGYVNCRAALSGEVAHSGGHGGPCPHSIKVCIVASDNDPSVMDDLRSAAGTKPVRLSTRDLILKTVEEAGVGGIRNADLHEKTGASSLTFYAVRKRLEKAGKLIRDERRLPDAAGRFQNQVVWHTPDHN